ncbi:MAG: hypothetical protein ABEJ65_09910 [bacterium]
MTPDSGDSEQSRFTYQVVGLVVSALLIVMFMMGAMYWLSMDVFVEFVDQGLRSNQSVLKHLGFYTKVSGVAVGIVSIVVVMYALSVSKSFAIPEDELDSDAELDETDQRVIRNWLYHELKWRLLGVLGGGVMVYFYSWWVCMYQPFTCLCIQQICPRVEFTKLPGHCNIMDP